MAVINDKEVNLRLMVPEDLHREVLKVQGLFTLKEGKKVPIYETYLRLVKRGATEIKKQNPSL